MGVGVEIIVALLPHLAGLRLGAVVIRGVGVRIDAATRTVRGRMRSLRHMVDHAVVADLTQRWSSGPVEGHVNRIKTIKRQMYGRANLDLLRKRVLATP